MWNPDPLIFVETLRNRLTINKCTKLDPRAHITISQWWCL